MKRFAVVALALSFFVPNAFAEGDASQQPASAAEIFDFTGADVPTDVTRPEFPVRPGGHIPLRYPEEALRAKEEGTVKLSFVVGADGSVSDIKVLQSSGYSALDAATVSRAATLKYVPALRNGIPVAARIGFQIIWALPGR